MQRYYDCPGMQIFDPGAEVPFSCSKVPVLLQAIQAASCEPAPTERRSAPGSEPVTFLNARENAASDW